MISDDTSKPSGDRTDDRRQREAAALRANLMRRKAQARSRRDGAERSAPDGRTGPSDDGEAASPRGDAEDRDDA